MTEFREVPYDEFLSFIRGYPRKLTVDKCGISEPPLVTYSDFSSAESWGAVVAKYHNYDDPASRIYRISGHLL